MTAPEPVNRFAREPKPRASARPSGAEGDPGPAPLLDDAGLALLVLAGLAAAVALYSGWGAATTPAPVSTYGAPVGPAGGLMDGLLAAAPWLGAAFSAAVSGLLLRAVAHHLRQQARLVVAAQRSA